MVPSPISFTLLYCFTITRSVYFYCILLSFYHSIRSILCSQLSWGWLIGHATGRAKCRLASQESPRLQHEKTGSVRRAGCASSRLATPPRRARAGWWRQELSNGYFTESGLAPTRTTEAKDGSDERHDQPQPISDRRPFPMTGSEAKGRGYASQMSV
jgi:hypothetical protein